MKIKISDLNIPEANDDIEELSQTEQFSVKGGLLPLIVGVALLLYSPKAY
ncbi:hypothetical protein [Fischerella sp. PCC 9605]|nr:hypothetical protein [Fischerella sp. PCC 9605]